MRPAVLASTLAIGLASPFAVLGCGSEDEASSPPVPTPSEIVAVLGSGESNYEPADGPEGLAKGSDLVVQGRLTNFAKGPLFGRSPDAPDAVTSLVVEVAVDRMVTGELPPGADGRLYVLDLGEGADAHNQVVPKDAPALLYLTEQAPASITPGAPVLEEDAGRPPGQPTFVFTTPQGLFIELSDSVIEPLEGVEYPGASLREFEPPEQRFPDDPVPVEPTQAAVEQASE